MNDENDKLNQIRHSCAHLLASAVMDLYPNAKRTIGPAIDSGFYYDFDFGDEKISEDDFEKIEEKMKNNLLSWFTFEHKEVSKDEAMKIFEGNQYKIELIEEFSKDGQNLTVYKSGNFEDLCKGGHCDNPSKEIGAFKLLSVAGAYWRGSEKNKMLTRIYGAAFGGQKELDAHMLALEDAKKRDHKKLGKELDLFLFSDLVGKGLPLWTSKGATIRRELERFVIDEEIRRGYLHVYTPDIAQIDLYKTSGHYPYYKDSMYAPIVIDDEEFMLRPMTCPHHFEIYKSRPRSYKELPMRLAELAKLYRYEQSGELAGLLRVRSFCLADAHIITQVENAPSEINSALDLIEFASGVFGLKANDDYWYRLSLGDRSDETKYFKSDNEWDLAEKTLREVLSTRSVRTVEAQGEAAFYGPKIDVQMKNVNGKEETAFTVQYDFVMSKRFKLTYIDETGTECEPIVVHRSSIGAVERTIAFLIERYAGAFPVWLAPVQATIIPISDKHLEYANIVRENLLKSNIRVEIDDRSETMQSKIRDAQMQKVPYMLVIGDKEKEAGGVAVRVRNGGNLGIKSVEAFKDDILTEIKNKIIM
ncbi:MAG: threonine--tRNA ligase [bacterium]|nr:threonine--tRNA ligase [bacterium]